ncbi:MAG TPA: MFS transporter [Polyangiales bacterium]|nr:MFS transporter [Polyangiales bacterium]
MTSSANMTVASVSDPPTWTREAIAVTLAASFGFALVQLDVTIINVALPTIADALHCDISGLQWLVDAYALTFAVLLLTCGALTDRFGAKRVYLFGLGLFAVASVLCGLAPTAPTLIAARCLQGVAAPAMLPSSLALLNHATGHNPGLRARAIGWWTAAGSITIAAGPIAGGLLVATAGWRSIFLVNLPLCALGAWLTWRCPSDTRSRPEPGAPARGLDLPGQLLAIVALGALTATVIELRPLGWHHPAILAGIAVSVIAWPAFLWVEATSRAPMLPLRIFRVPSFTPAVLYGVAVNLSYYGIVFVLSLYLQRVQGYSALRAGLAYLPLTATFFAINVWSGQLIGRVGVRKPMLFGALIDASGFALLLMLGASSSYWLMLPAFALIPAGMGLGVPAMTTTVLSSVDKSWSGVASGVLNAARQAAGVIGVALFGALAGDGSEHVVSGLHVAATSCIVLLLTAASIVFFAIRPPAPPQRPPG